MKCARNENERQTNEQLICCAFWWVHSIIIVCRNKNGLFIKAKLKYQLVYSTLIGQAKMMIFIEYLIHYVHIVYIFLLAYFNTSTYTYLQKWKQKGPNERKRKEKYVIKWAWKIESLYIGSSRMLSFLNDQFNRNENEK